MKKSDSIFYVYIVKTERGHLYTGISTDPARRIEEHNNGNRGSKCLRGQRPVKLVWSSLTGLSRSEALKFEAKIKDLSHERKLSFINGDFFLFSDGVLEK